MASKTPTGDGVKKPEASADGDVTKLDGDGNKLDGDGNKPDDDSDKPDGDGDKPDGDGDKLDSDSNKPDDGTEKPASPTPPITPITATFDSTMLPSVHSTPSSTIVSEAAIPPPPPPVPTTALELVESLNGQPLDEETLQVQDGYLGMIKDAAPRKADRIRGNETPIVTIIGAGISGLCAGYELQRRGFEVRLLERSSRVGGRIITLRDPVFAPDLHAEGGAMRIPKSHGLVHQYLKEFGLDSELTDFEMKNKFIHLSAIGRTLTMNDFNSRLKKQEDDKKLTEAGKARLKVVRDLFPTLKPEEKGKTADQLFDEATKAVRDAYRNSMKSEEDDGSDVDGDGNQRAPTPEMIKLGYHTIVKQYDKHTLRSFLEEEAEWSESAINLYNWSNAHVVFENSFIESLKDAFLSSNTQGQAAKMQQLRGGMDQLPKAFYGKLRDRITFGARVTRVDHPGDRQRSGAPADQVSIVYETAAGDEVTVKSDYVLFTVPYPAQRMIAKSRRFHEAKENAIMEVRYVQVTKVLLQYMKRWWDDELEKSFGKSSRGTGGGLVTDLPIRYTMFPPTEAIAGEASTEPSDSQKPAAPASERAVIMAAYAFGQDASLLSGLEPGDRVRKAAENLETAFPGSKQWLETGTSQAFAEDRMAGGSAFCYFAPGQKAKYHEAMRQPEWPCAGGVRRAFFAGEHASYAHGWIQGAIGTAINCVKDIVSEDRSRSEAYDEEATS